MSVGRNAERLVGSELAGSPDRGAHRTSRPRPPGRDALERPHRRGRPAGSTATSPIPGSRS